MIDTDKRFSCFFQKSELEHIPLHSLFDTMIQIVGQKNFSYDILAHSYYCILITRALNFGKNRDFQLQVMHCSTQNDISLVAEYIFQHYQEPICIENSSTEFSREIITFPQNLKNTTDRDLRAFYQKWYESKKKIFFVH